MGKQKKRRAPSPPNAPEEVEYSVEVIMAARKVDGEWEYLVKWYGFGDDENTWEPTENFHDCERLLNSFWSEVGEHKRGKTREGLGVTPREQWIEKEKKFFRQTREAEEKAARESVSNESDEDDIPLRILVGKTLEDIGNSDDDEPLSASFRRPTTFKETGLLQPQKHKPDVTSKTTKTISNKIAKKAAGMDVSSGKNKSPSISAKPPPLASTNRPEPGPSKPPENRPVTKPPTEARASHSVTQGSPVDPQTSSIYSRSQPTNQTAGADRRGPGKTQLLPSSIQSSSALSTKARIAEDMRKGPAPLNQSKYKGMRIPKNVNPPESRSPVISPTTSSQPAFDLSQKALLPLRSSEHTNQAPIRMAPLQQRSPPPPRPEEPPRDIEMDRMDVDQPDPPPSPPRPEDLTAADDLLHTIIPLQIPELMPKTPAQPIARSPTKVKLSELPRRDTKWSGTLFNSVSETDAEKLCDVTIQVHTPALSGLKLDLFLQKSNSIRLKKFHDLTDLDLILPSFPNIAQFASLAPGEEKDKEAFGIMRDYLLLKEKFTYCALSFANEVQAETDTAAYMFVTPMNKTAFTLLGAPGHIENKDALLVALAPSMVPTKEYREEMATLKSCEEVKIRFPVLSEPEDSTPLSAYHLARHILKVPKSLVTFLNHHPRSCVIWPEENTTSDVWISQDTQYLRFVLNHHRAKVFSPKGHVAARVVFVHVGRMKDIHTMPRIAHMRGTHLDLQFLTYGAHPSVPEREWGIRGFNISGGILTFTPNALATDLDGVDRLIERVAGHEHWACYVTPMVLGAAVQWAKESGKAALAAVISDRLGKRVSEGKVACMIAPPTNSHLSRHARDCDMWIEYQHMQSLLDPQEVVEDCEGMYEDVYGNAAKGDRDGLILSDLQQDLAKMSNQAAIRHVYRRFVIIKSDADVHGRPGEEDWCEWKLVSGFTFGDEVDT